MRQGESRMLRGRSLRFADGQHFHLTKSQRYNPVKVQVAGHGRASRKYLESLDPNFRKVRDRDYFPTSRGPSRTAGSGLLVGQRAPELRRDARTLGQDERDLAVGRQEARALLDVL